MLLLFIFPIQEKTLLNRDARKSRLGSVKKTPAMTQLNGMVVCIQTLRKLTFPHPPTNY